MEMIAMLGGLGQAGPYLDNPSPAARAAANEISMAKTVDEVMAVKAGIPNMGLSQAEAATLTLIADKRIDQITTPFYKRPGYWLVIAGLAAAWYHRDKIKRAIGLSGLGGYSEAKELIAKADDRIGGFGGDPPGNDIVEAYYYLGLADANAAEVRDPNIDADMMNAKMRANDAWNRWTKKHCRL